MDRINIAYIEQDSGIGGAEVNLFSLFERMDREVFYPIVIVPYEGPLTERLKELGVRFHVIRRERFTSTSFYIAGKKVFNPFAVLYDILAFLPTILKIKTFLRKEGIDVVHTNSMFAHIYGSIAARLASVPCIWHMQDIVDPRMAFGLVRRVLVYLGGILPKRIVVVSKATGAMFDGKIASKVRVLHNGVDTKEFSPEKDGDIIRKELGFDSHERVVGIVGRLTQWKGQKEFLRAAAGVAASEQNVKFLVVGDTTFTGRGYKDELFRLAKDLKLDSKVIFTGERKDIPSLLRVMDVLVHASIRPEPFGLVIIEGMSSGVPVIAADEGGPREIIAEGEDGFLVDPSRTGELVEAIIRLLKDGPLRKRIAEAARRKVEKQFTVDNFVRQFENLYLETFH